MKPFKKKISAVLLDSGGVINYPDTGNWFLPPRFFDIVEKAYFDKYSKRDVEKAIAEAYVLLNKIPLIETVEQEKKLFAGFYREFGKLLSELKIDEEKVAALSEETVCNLEKYGYYIDAVKALPLIHEHYKTAIVSDAWPSLRDTYHDKKLDKYIDSMIISSELGTLKPDKMMYLRALSDLDVTADECIFVDDNVKNCFGAKTVGITPVLICRTSKDYLLYRLRYPNLHIIRNFDELLKLLSIK